MERKQGETFEEYKARRKAANAETKAKLRRAFWVHENGRTVQPYGELSPAQARRGTYTRRAHEDAAVRQYLNLILLLWIAQFLTSKEAV